MVKMLEQVVLSGTGTNAIIPATAWPEKRAPPRCRIPARTNSWSGLQRQFRRIRPANNPVLSMIVVVERPETTIFGGAVAAPIFQEVMSYALHHYNIPSNGTYQKR